MTSKKTPSKTKAKVKPKLTVKQQDYKNNRLSGMDRQPAYKAAYSAKGMNSASITKETEKLEAHPLIAPLLLAGSQEAADKAIVTLEMVLNGLLAEAAAGNVDSTSSSRVSAWKTLSDYTGSFDANKQKVEHSGKVDYTNLTDEQLAQKILELSDA